MVLSRNRSITTAAAGMIVRISMKHMLQFGVQIWHCCWLVATEMGSPGMWCSLDHRLRGIYK
jgi:hypothetical protein